MRMLLHTLCVALIIAMATGQPMLGMGGNQTNPHWKTMMTNVSSPMPMDLGNITASIARQADLDQNGFITGQEFLQFVLNIADKDGDTQATLAEQMDGFRTRFPNIAPEVLAVLHSSIENVTFNDSDSPSAEEFQQGMKKWIEEAVHVVQYRKASPFLVGEPDDVEFDYNLFFHHLDTNDDTIITPSELFALLAQYSSSGSVDREQWITRNAETYGENRVVAAVLFDYLDVSNDLRIDSVDGRQILTWADANHDERVTKQEMYRFMQRKDKLVRRMLGLPIKPFVYDCPEPMWKDGDDCEPALEGNLITMDTDFDFDGSISVWELQNHLRQLDQNMDGQVDRVEFIQIYSQRYKQDMASADVEFDAADMNGDGIFSWEDYEKHFHAQAQSVCACEYRLAALTSARVSQHLAKERKTKMQLMRMKYFVLLNNFLPQSAPLQTRPQDQWTWETMNGKPAVGGACNRCSAKQNWGQPNATGAEEEDDDEVNDEQESKIVQTVISALKKLRWMDQWSESERDWRTMKLLMFAMRFLNEEKNGTDVSMNNDNDKEDDSSDMAKWMAWKMATMKLGKGKDRMGGWGQEDKDEEEKGQGKGGNKGQEDEEDDEDDAGSPWKGSRKGSMMWELKKKLEKAQEEYESLQEKWQDIKEKKEKVQEWKSKWSDLSEFKEKFHALKDAWEKEQDKQQKKESDPASFWANIKFPWEADKEEDDSEASKSSTGSARDQDAMQNGWWMNWKGEEKPAGSQDQGEAQSGQDGDIDAAQWRKFNKWLHSYQQQQQQGGSRKK